MSKVLVHVQPIGGKRTIGSNGCPHTSRMLLRYKLHEFIVYCFAGACQPISAPEHGFLNLEANHACSGATVEFTCEPNHKLVGFKSLLCLDGGKWSAAAPVCRSKLGFYCIRHRRRDLFAQDSSESNNKKLHKIYVSCILGICEGTKNIPAFKLSRPLQ